MRTFIESDLKFEFSTAWWLEQYDNLTDYINLKNVVPGSKGVDFIGILNNETLSFIEVKNFRGHRIESKPRLQLGEDPIEIEVAQKVRDTLAGITAAARNSTHLKNEWQRVLTFLQNDKKNVEVILWLEEDSFSHSVVANARRNKSNSGTLSRRVKQKMTWLTTRVFVCHISDNQYKESLAVNFIQPLTD